MKRNPVIPYAIIAVVGILLVVVISFVGVGQQKAIQEAEKNGGQKQEQKGGETAAADPATIFQNNCASCHGADLSGGFGPALNTIGSKYSKDELLEIIKTGFPSAGMPAGLVQGQQAEALAKWLAEKK